MIVGHRLYGASLVVLLAFTATSYAETWTGSADSSWTNPANWDTNTVPGAGGLALFNGAGNGNTTISLAGAAQPINTVQFDNSAAAYTIGPGAGDALAFDSGGQVLATNVVTNNESIAAGSQAAGSLTITNGASNGITAGSACAVNTTDCNGTVGNLSMGAITMSGGGALTVSLPGTNNTARLNGNITDGGSSASLVLSAGTTGTTNNNNVVINGTNTYGGGTTITFNTGNQGSIQIGSDSAFGTGKIINNLISASNQWKALGGTRTISNAIDLNGGMTYVGSNGFNFTGPIIEASGTTRTMQNSGPSTVTFGSAGSPSTITLGNPAANGGDDLGRTMIFTPAATSTIVINDVMKDPAPGGGTASGGVTYQGSAGGIVTINGQNTYTGITTLGSGTIHIQFNHDFVVGGTSGPFGIGTILANNTSPQPILEPFGGDRTLNNPFDMNFGFTIGNVGSDLSGLILTNTLALRTSGRTITNNLSYDTATGNGGTFTLGSAGSPSTITLSTGTNQTLVLTGTGKYVINDTILDSATGNAITYTNTAQGTAPVTINSQSSYNSQTNLSGSAQIIRVATSSDGLPGASFTKGPFGKGTLNFNNTTNQHLRPTGGNRLISNAVTMTSGFNMDNAAGETFNITMAGPITMTGTGRVVTNGFVAGSGAGTLILGDATAPNTITLPTAANQTLTIGALTGPIIVNDVIKNATGIVGNVAYNTKSSPPEGSNQPDNNPVTINAQNTYTGTTTFGDAAVASTGQVQFTVSSVGNPGSITSGPFGTGTLVFVNTTTGTPPLTPLGADRTVNNAVSMNGNMAAANAGAETFNLNLNGPITLNTLTPTDFTNRSLVNAMAGTLTLGGTGSPPASTITLGTTAAETLTFQSTAASATTVVNDVIQNATGGGAGIVSVGNGTVRLNAANTYTGGTSVSGGKLLVNNTSGSGTGTGAVTVAAAGTLGGTGTISGAITNSGTIAPGLPAGAPATLTAGNNVLDATGATWAIDLSGASADKLAVGGNIDLSATDALTVSGAGTGSSWVIATYTGTLTGTFDTVSPGYTVNYGTGTNSQITLNAAPAGLPGDFNSDGKVDAGDYVTWRKNNGTNNALANDGGLGTPIGTAHYNLWRANFGNPPGSGTGGLSGGAVPEPGSWLLALLAIFTLTAAMARRNRRQLAPAWAVSRRNRLAR